MCVLLCQTHVGLHASRQHIHVLVVADVVIVAGVVVPVVVVAVVGVVVVGVVRTLSKHKQCCSRQFVTGIKVIMFLAATFL